MALTPENWNRDGARAVSANNHVVGPVSELAVKFSMLGMIQHHDGYGQLIYARYIRALMANGLSPDTQDIDITLSQANSVLSTYLRLGNER